MVEPRTYPSGVTSWIDVEQPDPERAENFYGTLFGWTFETVTPPQSPFRYAIARLDGRDVAGIGSDSGRGPQWNTYVAVEDADATMTAIEANGGRVRQPPTQAGEGGRSSIFEDPTGVELRTWEAAKRPGAQLTNVPGAWNFSDLHSDDPARGFYSEVFGWVFDDAGPNTFIKVPGYGDHLAATVDPGIFERQQHAPPGFADVIGGVAPLVEGERPHWQVTFTVEDREQTIDLVVGAGGEVLSVSEDDWTRHARVLDPQGATFVVSQFAPPDSWTS